MASWTFERAVWVLMKGRKLLDGVYRRKKHAIADMCYRGVCEEPYDWVDLQRQGYHVEKATLVVRIPHGR